MTYNTESKAKYYLSDHCGFQPTIKEVTPSTFNEGATYYETKEELIEDYKKIQELNFESQRVLSDERVKHLQSQLDEDDMYNTESDTFKYIDDNIGKLHFVVSLTDGEYTSYDVSFSLVYAANKQEGLYHSGINTQEFSLCVAINTKCCFIFSLNKTDKHARYVQEKLNISEGNYVIAQQIANIINYITEHVQTRRN